MNITILILDYSIEILPLLASGLASEKNRLQKVLGDGGIRLGGMVSEIHGVSAQAMIGGLIAGQPVKETYVKGRLKGKQVLMAEALDEPLSDLGVTH